MKKVAIILAQGFEEIEAVTPFDILNRAGADVKFVSLDSLFVKGAHGITIKADYEILNFNFSNCDMIVLPGGMPGALNLANSHKLIEILQEFNRYNKICAAICAAPIVFARAGILSSPYTCYPGFESEIKIAIRDDKNVVKNENIITSKGPATAIEFSIALVQILFGDKLAEDIKSAILFDLKF